MAKHAKEKTPLRLTKRGQYVSIVFGAIVGTFAGAGFVILFG